MSNIGGLVAFGIAGLIGIAVVGGSWYTIDEGERGVYRRNGRVVDTVGPGMHFKMPFIDDINKVSIQTKTFEYTEVPAYSKDQQTALLQFSVTSSILPDQVKVADVQYGGEEGVMSRLVTPQVLEESKNVFGQFNAETIIKERPRLNAEIQSALQKAVEGTPVRIESFQITNIDFSDAYENAIEERMVSEVQISKTRQVAETEKVNNEIALNKAKAEADAQIASAQARAEATRLQGEAEAAAIKAKGDAIRQNPQLVELMKTERWDGKLPVTMVPGGTVPFLDMTTAVAPVETVK